MIHLYPHVCYEDLDNIHPRAIKVIVPVKDPRGCLNPRTFGRSRCRCCPMRFVYIQICVPPRGPCKLEIKRRDRSKIEYDYGKYEVEITSKNGVVYVDYDD